MLKVMVKPRTAQSATPANEGGQEKPRRMLGSNRLDGHQDQPNDDGEKRRPEQSIEFYDLVPGSCHAK